MNKLNDVKRQIDNYNTLITAKQIPFKLLHPVNYYESAYRRAMLALREVSKLSDAEAYNKIDEVWRQYKSALGKQFIVYIDKSETEVQYVEDTRPQYSAAFKVGPGVKMQGARQQSSAKTSVKNERLKQGNESLKADIAALKAKGAAQKDRRKRLESKISDQKKRDEIALQRTDNDIKSRIVENKNKQLSAALDENVELKKKLDDLIKEAGQKVNEFRCDELAVKLNNPLIQEPVTVAEMNNYAGRDKIDTAYNILVSRMGTISDECKDDLKKCLESIDTIGGDITDVDISMVGGFYDEGDFVGKISGHSKETSPAAALIRNGGTCGGEIACAGVALMAIHPMMIITMICILMLIFMAQTQVMMQPYHSTSSTNHLTYRDRLISH